MKFNERWTKTNSLTSQNSKSNVTSSRLMLSLLLGLFFALFFSFNCAAGDVKFTAEEPANFWLGLWHGAIAGIAFIVSLFSDTVRVYEINNNGGWYDFGFLFGVIAIWGGSSAKSYHYGRYGKGGKFEAKWDSKWEKKCETKMEEIFKDWAEEDDKEWEEIGKKIEKKLKRKIKEWADKE